MTGGAAVVTGAAGGLGLGLAVVLLERGHEVVLVDVDSESLDASVATLGATYRGRVLGRSADVAVAGELERVRRAAEATFGPVQVVCNNAGVSPPAGRVTEHPAEVWDWTLSVNTMGTVNGIRAFVPGMIERGCGTVINTASLLALGPTAMAAPYAASKAALVALSISLREELRGTGVAVAVAFPHVASNITRSHLHWPDRMGTNPFASRNPELRDDAVAHDLATASYVASGLTPVEAARAVLAGIDAGRFWVAAGAGHELFAGAIPARWPDLDAPALLD